MTPYSARRTGDTTSGTTARRVGPVVVVYKLVSAQNSDPPRQGGHRWRMAGARRERSVRRHRQGCRPAVLKVVPTSTPSTWKQVGPSWVRGVQSCPAGPTALEATPLDLIEEGFAFRVQPDDLRVRPDGPHCVEVHDPGAPRVEAGFGESGNALMRLVLRVAHRFAATPAKGAQTITYLASSPAISGVTGSPFYQERATASSPQSYEA